MLIICEIAYSQGCFDHDMRVPIGIGKMPSVNKANQSKVISIYLETDLYTRNQLGSNAATENWLRGIFMDLAMIYGNEGISTAFTDSYWPLSSSEDWSNGLQNDPFALLNAFGEKRKDSPAGRLKHFVSMNGNPQGIAWVGVLTSNYTPFTPPMGIVNHAGPYAVTLGMSSTASTWNIRGTSHEMGHNMGCQHTHECDWGDGTQRIDNCDTPNESRFPCNPSNPMSQYAEDNTMMSYCSNYSAILDNGFGVEPGDLMRSQVANATIDLSGGYCAKIIYLAGDIQGDYFATDDVILHPGVVLDGTEITMDCGY